MKPVPDDGIDAAGIHRDEEYGLPCMEALLARTLALMTGHAQACCADHRVLMAQKTAANLDLLAAHPMFSAGFRDVAQRLKARWAIEAGALQTEPVSSPQIRALWHTTPEVIQ